MTGMYKEVMDLMRNIHIDRLPVDIHPYYYHIYRTVYGLMADYAVTAYERSFIRSLRTNIVIRCCWSIKIIF